VGDAVAAPLSDGEYEAVRRLMQTRAGVHLPPTKKMLISNRLAPRLRDLGLQRVGDYLRHITTDPAELARAIDLLTTHETYFFREEKHFAALAEYARQAARRGQPFRVWSAACSSGEEAYSAAMVLAAEFPDREWEVVGTDVSERAVASAALGHYPLQAAERIPRAYLRQYCLKGIGSQAGTLAIDPALRRRTHFERRNLDQPLTELGLFDVVFLRNVLIYFTKETKQRVVRRVAEQIRGGGLLFIGHSESLAGIECGLHQLRPAVLRREME